MQLNRDFLKSFNKEERIFLESIMGEIGEEYGDSKSVKLVHLPTNVVATCDWSNSIELNTEEALLQLVRNVIKWNNAANSSLSYTYRMTDEYKDSFIFENIKPEDMKPKKKCSICQRIRNFFTGKR